MGSRIVGGWGGMHVCGGIVYCGLVRIMDFCFPVLFFYNNFNLNYNNFYVLLSDGDRANHICTVVLL